VEALGYCPVCPPLNPALPGPITLIFSPRRAVVMTHTRAKIKFKMSVQKLGVETAGQTDGRTRLDSLLFLLTRSATMTSVVLIASYDVTSVRTHNIGSMQF